MFLFSPIRSVELKGGRVGQLECNKRCCVVQGLQEVTLRWSSVEFGWVGTSGASTRGQMAILDQVFAFDFPAHPHLFSLSFAGKGVYRRSCGLW